MKLPKALLIFDRLF